MKKLSKSTKALLPLVIALVVVAVVFGVIFVKSQETQQTQSKAADDPLAQCLSFCKRVSLPNIVEQNRARATCATTCPTFVDETMSCNDFCGKFIPSSSTTPRGALPQCIDYCGKQLIPLADPCITQRNGVCAKATANQEGCKTACKTVQDGTKTCDEAFARGRYASKTLLNDVTLGLIKRACREAFK